MHAPGWGGAARRGDTYGQRVSGRRASSCAMSCPHDAMPRDVGWCKEKDVHASSGTLTTRASRDGISAVRSANGAAGTGTFCRALELLWATAETQPHLLLGGIDLALDGRLEGSEVWHFCADVWRKVCCAQLGLVLLLQLVEIGTPLRNVRKPQICDDVIMTHRGLPCGRAAWTTAACVRRAFSR